LFRKSKTLTPTTRRAPKITTTIKYPRSEPQLGPALYIGFEYDLIPLFTIKVPSQKGNVLPVVLIRVLLVFG